MARKANWKTVWSYGGGFTIKNQDNGNTITFRKVGEGQGYRVSGIVKGKTLKEESFMNRKAALRKVTEYKRKY